tara:strand:- start:16333 stop:16722 length:390 start_codon:yes stop_codon:yes gene_type:complete
MLFSPYSEFSESRRPMANNGGRVWHRPKPLPGCHPGLWSAVSKVFTRCWWCWDFDEYVDLDEPTTSRVAREERLKATEGSSDDVLRRFQARAVARSDVARRVSAMSTNESETSEEEEKASNETKTLIRQ